MLLVILCVSIRWFVGGIYIISVCIKSLVNPVVVEVKINLEREKKNNMVTGEKDVNYFEKKR
jgi:hypothetical protein